MPGSTSANATEIFQEGLLLPPVKIYSRGVFNDDLERLILANSRQPELVRGDMHAQMAATQMGAERILKTARNSGCSGDGGVHGAAQRRRRGVARCDQGAARRRSLAEGFMDNDGVELDRPVRFAGTVRVANGEITFDFSNSDRQAKGPINLRPSMVEACVFYSLIGALDPSLHFNDGMRDVVRFVYAPDTVANAWAPAPVSSYQAANLKLTDVILEALAPFRPARALANAGSSGAILISWKDGGPGQPSMQYEILGSAYGGARATTAPRRWPRTPQPAHHADRDPGNGISLPDHRIRPGGRFLRRGRIPRRACLPADLRIAAGCEGGAALRPREFPPTASPAASPAAAAVFHPSGHGGRAGNAGFGPLRFARRRALPAAKRGRRRLRRSEKTRPRGARADIAEGYVRPRRPRAITAARNDHHGG